MSARIAASQNQGLNWAIPPIPEKRRGHKDLPTSSAIERLPIRRNPEIRLSDSNSIGADRRAIIGQQQCAIPDISFAIQTRHSSRTQRLLEGIANPPTRPPACGATIETFYTRKKRGRLGCGATSIRAAMRPLRTSSLLNQPRKWGLVRERPGLRYCPFFGSPIRCVDTGGEQQRGGAPRAL